MLIYSESQKKGRKFFVLCLIYLRLLRTTAAATTAMITTAAAIAMYVAVGIPLAGASA
jgi:hypothetical protein